MVHYYIMCLSLNVKVISTKMVMQRGGGGRSSGPQARQMRIAECLVGDETGIIIFTATSKVRIHYICTHIHIRNLFAFMAALAYLLKV
ncbi:hypothetical protein Bca4012_006740 [Brassica carinata]